MTRTLLILALISGILLSGAGHAGAQAVDSDAIPPEVARHADEWPLPNQSYASARVATSAINRANVASLGLDWSFALSAQSAFGAAATNPLIIDGVVYLQDLASNVFAIDLASGGLRWEKRYDILNFGPNGAAVGYGKVFASVAPSFLVALDAKTGDELWRTKLSENPEIEGIYIQPVVYGSQVLLSTVPNSGVTTFYHGGAHGFIMALDQATGAINWRFDTIDDSNLWGNPEVNSGGGAWYPPAVDTASGLTYWGTGNAAPYPGTRDYPNASSRPGPNLYTSSLLALGQQDGALAWYFQAKPHDLFDLDFQSSPILTQATIDGADREVVIGSGKVGYVYALDRATGAVLWKTSVGAHQNDELDEVPAGQRITILPGVDGGVETPMALAPDGILYVPTLNLPTDFSSTQIYGLNLTKGTSEMDAIDIHSGRILWTKPFDGLLLGGATVVNDLLFTADYEGALYALDRQTGAFVWSYQTPNNINASPAIVGDTVVWPLGMNNQPQLVALKLGKAEGQPKP